MFTDGAELDITDREAVWSFFEMNQVDAFVNCSAYTAVDRAETETELADRINHLAAKYLAEAAKEFNVKFVHVSTDYVFDVESFQPYEADSIPNPQSIYGVTKLAGERAILALNLSSALPPMQGTWPAVSWMFCRSRAMIPQRSTTTPTRAFAPGMISRSPSWK